ncbi:hypothetical protein BpHYR1_026500 [Brachionus plicatilis]|uniref:Uncharacterized protein n=1 Tax=Brachionus plicatilis TaxID=10195 RepID=A0A3M7PA42_BRAPC|nr:hypothetical protein BpHYR1_026500 [Brachionus plicatilis]
MFRRNLNSTGFDNRSFRLVKCFKSKHSSKKYFEFDKKKVSNAALKEDKLKQKVPLLDTDQYEIIYSKKTKLKLFIRVLQSNLFFRGYGPILKQIQKITNILLKMLSLLSSFYFERIFTRSDFKVASLEITMICLFIEFDSLKLLSAIFPEIKVI